MVLIILVAVVLEETLPLLETLQSVVVVVELVHTRAVVVMEVVVDLVAVVVKEQLLHPVVVA